MKLIFWIVGLPLLLLAAAFAVANHHMVVISLWPLADPLDVPLYVAIGLPLYAGVLIGALVAWISGGSTRKRARVAARRVAALEREKAELQARLDAATAARGTTVTHPSHQSGAPTLPSFLP